MYVMQLKTKLIIIILCFHFINYTRIILCADKSIILYTNKSNIPIRHLNWWCWDKIPRIWLTHHATFLLFFCIPYLKVNSHLLYGMNNYVLIWGNWLSCDPLRGSHDSQSPHIWIDWLSCDPLRKHLCPILWQLCLICHKIIHTI